MDHPLVDAYRHEALDRVNTMSVMLEALLADHLFVVEHQEIKAKVERIADALGDLYQEINRAE